MKHFRRMLCLVLTAVFILQFAACKKNSEPENDDTAQKEKTEEAVKYAEKWLLSPSIQADAIYSLPIVSFNKTTNHYDVSFGDNFVIEKDGKYGLIDSNGKLVISPEFDSIETCTCYEGYIATVKEGEYYTTTYHIDSNNQKLWTYSHTCDGFSGYAYKWNDASSTLSAEEVGSEGAYPASIVPVLPETAEITDGSSDTEKYALVNNGKAVGKGYNGAGVFTGGVAAVQSDGKWGYVNSEGKTVIPFEFSAIEGYNALKGENDTPYESSEGYITLSKDGKFGIYSSEGKQIIPCQYTYLTTVHDGRAFASQDGKSWGILLVDEKISNGIASDDEVTAVTAESTTSAAW